MKILTVAALICAMVALTTAAAKNTLSCDEDWYAMSGRLFQYIPTPMTWAEAEKHCQRLGGNLASIHSSTEFHHIEKLIMTATGKLKNWRAWMGGSDIHKEDKWLWSDGTPFEDVMWCRRQPDNQGGYQHCLQMAGAPWWYDVAGRACLDDFECYGKLPSVCAMKV